MNLLEAYSREVLARFIWSRHTGAADILRRQLDGIESICRAEHVAARLQEVQVELEDLRGRRSAATIRRARYLRRQSKRLQRQLEGLR